MLPPDPSDRAIKAGSGSISDRVLRSSTIQIVPEAKRHEEHVQQIKGHPFQDLAHHCLQDDTTARPTAAEICDTLQQLSIHFRCYGIRWGNIMN